MRITLKMWKKIFYIWKHAIDDVIIEDQLEEIYDLIEEMRLTEAEQLLSKVMGNPKTFRYPSAQYTRIESVIRRKKIIGE